MKKIVKLSLIGFMMFALCGCCFSVGSITIGKDCNKKMYCAVTPVTAEFDAVINSNYSDAYKEAVKSVVTIVSSTTVGATSNNSTGSGVVFKEDSLFAYIVTNKHVVTTSASSYLNAHSRFEVTFHDYTKRSAQLVGFAAAFDIAVLKVSKTNITAGTTYVLPEVASSFTDVEIGNNVFAIGSPMSKSHAFSTSYGAVSNLFNVSVSTSANLGSYYPIQMDASVNPGNSGGGLFNLDAELIGIVQGGRTSSSSESVVTTGINYAIPIDTALRVANYIIDNPGTPSVIAYYSIGLPGSGTHFIREIENPAVYGLSSSEKEGIYLASNPRTTSAAYQAGLREHFVITSVNGIKINNFGTLDMFEKSLNANDEIVVKGHYRNDVSAEATIRYVAS